MENKMRRLIIVSGLSCVGKTVYSNAYSNKFNIPILHFDQIHNYRNKVTNYNSIKSWIDSHLNEIFILDSIHFGIDPDLSILISNIPKDIEIEIHFLYMDIPKLSKNQLDKSNTIVGYNLGMTDLNEINRVNKGINKNLNHIIKTLFSKNIISKIIYVHRDGTKYEIFENDSHLLESIGEKTNE